MADIGTAALKTAIQGLKQFFVAAGQDGHLGEEAGVAGVSRPVKRQKVGAEQDSAADGAAAPGPAPADADAQYREWLGRQYGNYVRQLLALSTGSAAGAPQPPAAARSAGVAVVSAAALMECVRSEGGPGSFSGPLYGRFLAGLLSSPAARPEVFSLLFSKYLSMADVRFYTLAAVRALATKYGDAALRGAAPVSEADEGESEDGGEAGAAAAGEAALAAAAGSSGGASASASSVPQLSLPDLARNAFDVLSRLEPELPADPAEWATWCGAAEYKLVVAAVDKNESARARRKRKQAEAAGAGAAGQADAAQAKAPARRAQWANPKMQKRLFGDAWLALLSLPLPPDVLRGALLRLPGSVIPALPAPVRLADFLTHCLGRSGLTGMLALHGIFLLVTRHGLEYPRFYERLYQLLVPQAFAARSRSQFFRLADTFLSSGLVPAYTVAAFAKRFARLALTAPPPGACIAIAFIHNLLRRHPALQRMLHDPAAASAAATGTADGGTQAGAKPKSGKKAGGGAAGGPGVDVYDESEPDPAKSRAVESSLWEVEALRNHYCPQVSTFCAVLDKDLSDRTKTAEINLEEVLGAADGQTGGASGGASSYNALIRAELSRKLRKVPVAFYSKPPVSLFDTMYDGEDWGGWSLAPATSNA
ncbi:hypothetical protein GPECTOR_3g22 [Gonium pectorale]|uniref:CCAAT-binding factor domain-containing protein n=1 Tax=Gonium pectorale TaxID=33097 RepID=A0A150GZC0_GONPE|nr:hypothetical protein GPECTOR_3g22 [Gonium pectorale]|eukprot:KXZ55062.1 hypothetical protein GPECTOR_3g22 [Gonium pectorale]